MATIAGVCIAYGSPSLFATLHGPRAKSKDNPSNGHTPALDFPPFEQAGKFRHHDMLRAGFPALQECFDQQEKLCQRWMPKVAATLVSTSLHI